MKLLLSLLKTIYFNFRFLPLDKAIRLPIFVYYKCKLDIKCAKIHIELPPIIYPAMVRIGFHKEAHIDSSLQSVLHLDENSRVIFKGEAHIGYGSKIIIFKGGEVEFGNNFTISSNSVIIAKNKIKFGDNNLLSWGGQIMDSDSHKIYSSDNVVRNLDLPVVVGNNVWIGCNVTILKGTIIPNNCVIGANSVLSGSSTLIERTIVVGNPAKSVHPINRWER